MCSGSRVRPKPWKRSCQAGDPVFRSRRGVATTLIGTADPRELELNLQWAAEPLDEDLLTLVEDMLGPIHNVTWTTGRPENN